LSLAGISCPVDYFDTMSDRRALVEIKESRATRRLASNCSSKEPFQHDKNRKFFSEIRFAHLVLHRYQREREQRNEQRCEGRNASCHGFVKNDKD
jgi:hypothetical protein